MLGAYAYFNARAHSSPQTRMEIYLPAGLHPDFTSFRTCTPSDSSSQIKRYCTLGFGSLPKEQRYFSLVNGPPRNGRSTMWVQYGKATATASSAHVGGAYSDKLTLNIPPYAGHRDPFARLRFFTGFVQATHGGAFLQATAPCPSGGWPVKVRFTFADHRTVKATATAACA